MHTNKHIYSHELGIHSFILFVIDGHWHALNNILNTPASLYPSSKTLPKRPLTDAFYRHQTAGHRHTIRLKNSTICSEIVLCELCTRFAILLNFFLTCI